MREEARRRGKLAATKRGHEMNYTLEPALETYGPNIKVTGILVAIGGLFCGLAYAVALDALNKTAWAVFVGMTAVFSGLLLHHLRSRVWVHDPGISFRGILGYGEMRWQDVERMFFYSYEVHAHGHKISLGERIRCADELAERIAKATLERLLQKSVEEFQSGAVVDFGSILVDRKSTRLNSSHLGISYAVFCLKKKKKTKLITNLKKRKKKKKKQH